MKISFKNDHITDFIAKEDLAPLNSLALEHLKDLYQSKDKDRVKGWIDPEKSAVQLNEIKEKAREIRDNADVFVLVGVGGSNQAARAIIEALQEPGGPEIIYAGNTLSAHYLQQILNKLEGKSVYINVIAKNFETLEPGSHFRILRNYLAKRYSGQDLEKRIIVTGSLGSDLHQLAKKHRYMFLEFPLAIGGRFSAFSPVALFPLAVAGLDIDSYLLGAKTAAKKLAQEREDNMAVSYAASRNLLYKEDYTIEILASFEPQLDYFAKWWIQLFGESEGKDGKGIFPVSVSYSEDLHSMGQYIQDGRRNLMETFIRVKDPRASVLVEEDLKFADNFDYLNGKDFSFINHAAEKATIEAHLAGGLPCMQVNVPYLDEEIFGELYYFFMVACAISGKLLGVNPYDQEGVEEYKRSMFLALEK